MVFGVPRGWPSFLIVNLSETVHFHGFSEYESRHSVGQLFARQTAKLQLENVIRLTGYTSPWLEEV